MYVLGSADRCASDVGIDTRTYMQGTPPAAFKLGKPNTNTNIPLWYCVNCFGILAWISDEKPIGVAGK